MIVAVLWWLAQVAGIGLIAYLVLWAVDYSGVPAPFSKALRLGVTILAVVVLIVMVLRLFVILGHPLA